MSKNTEVTVVQEFQLPALSSEMSTAMAEEMDGLQLTFDRVKIPSGGGITFEIDNGTDQPDAEKEIIGVIVDHHPVNAYWAQSFTGGSNPPDCASMDGKYGVGSPGGSCKTCTLNQYGSAFDGRGKACKNMHRIFIMRSGETLPLLLALPPTSLRGLSDYIAKRIITRLFLKIRLWPWHHSLRRSKRRPEELRLRWMRIILQDHPWPMMRHRSKCEAAGGQSASGILKGVRLCSSMRSWTIKKYSRLTSERQSLTATI